jgi:hypothetical protein
MVGINTNASFLNTGNFFFAKKNPAETSAQNNFIKKNISSAPDGRPQDFLNPLHSFTRINGHSIPRYVPPAYAPKFSAEFCTAHLSHEQWWASLDDEIKLSIDSLNNVIGNGEHLKHLTSEERFHHVNSVKEHNKMLEYSDKVWAELSELATSMGMKLSGMSGQSYPLKFTTAFFESVSGEGKNMILTILGDGRKIFTDVPESFTQQDFVDFNADILPKLLEKHGLNHADVSASRLKRFFEEIFEELFKNSEV